MVDVDYWSPNAYCAPTGTPLAFLILWWSWPNDKVCSDQKHVMTLQVLDVNIMVRWISRTGAAVIWPNSFHGRSVVIPLE